MTRLPSSKREQLYDGIRAKDCICAGDGCTRPARTWVDDLPICETHWRRRRTHGSLDLPRRQTLKDHSCAAPGCDSPACLRSDQLAVCRKHWQRWRDTGSLTLRDRRRRPDGSCSVDGCTRPLHSKNLIYCRTHYFRLRRGSAKGLVPMRSQCERCGAGLKGNQSRWCSDKCQWRQQQNVALQRLCIVCKTPFEFMRTQATCSRECARSLIRHHKQTRRVLERDPTRPREIFYDREIFARDNWICQICKQPVDPFKVHPEPLAPTIDHIIPLSRGGLHVRRNIQTAHSHCNGKKHRKLPAELVQSGFVCGAV